MKSSTSPTIKAHLIRDGLGLLLLTATHTTPPALAGGTCDNYTTSTCSGTIVPGDTDTGNHCDDCATVISFPFLVSVYGQSFTLASVASNGSLELLSPLGSPFTHGCLTLPDVFWGMAIFPYQDDLRTDNLSFAGCSGFPGGSCGIYTATTGVAPNRIFYVEWRATHFADTTTSANFEIAFYENDLAEFDVIYGATNDSGSDETSGVQASSSGPVTTFSCGVPALTSGSRVAYTCEGAPSPSGCQFEVLIASSDLGVPPGGLHDQIAAEPGVRVDYFDAQLGTPSLAQLLPYRVVVPFSNSAYADPVAMGDVLADYADAGGIVVGFNFDWFGAPFGLEGRWQTDGYGPFVEGGVTHFTDSCLGSYDMSHPLMQGINAGSLCGFFRHTLDLTSGAVSVAEFEDGAHLAAYQIHHGHAGVGINVYPGENPGNWSGPFGRVVVNAGRWLIFTDGFESGNSDYWSAQVPPPGLE